MDSQKTLMETVQTFPTVPGVYLMRDGGGKYLYIGKAVNIKNRVRSYFQNKNDGRYQIPFLIKKVETIEWIATNSETEALILEANLIRLYQPAYNVLLRDDKHFPYLKITINEPFPQLLKVRKIQDDGARYFGPYTDVKTLNSLVQQVRKVFRIRPCSRNLPSPRQNRPCINHSIKQCSGACSGFISQEEYRTQIDLLIQFLRGRRREVLNLMQKTMEAAAIRKDYEQAAQVRDQIVLVEKNLNSQRVDLKDNDAAIDVFGLSKSANSVCLCILTFRQGLLMAKRHFLFDRKRWDVTQTDHDYLVLNYYRTTRDDLPNEILLQPGADFSCDLLSSWFLSYLNQQVQVSAPERGWKGEIIALASKNAHLFQVQKSPNEPSAVIHQMMRELHLPELPETIEAFDISNLGDKDAVAGMVHFTNGTPDKSQYRRFKIKSVSGQNDFAMLMEAVTRRLTRLQKEEKPFPKLLLIDGGKGQLSSAMKPLTLFPNPPMIASLAKGEETLFSPYHDSPIQLTATNPVRKLVQRIRDEVHRFSLSYHRTLRNKKTTHSALESIPQIGKRRAHDLLLAFGSLKRLKEASIEEISTVQGFSRELSENVYNALRTL